MKEPGSQCECSPKLGVQGLVVTSACVPVFLLNEAASLLWRLPDENSLLQQLGVPSMAVVLVRPCPSSAALGVGPSDQAQPCGAEGAVTLGYTNVAEVIAVASQPRNEVQHHPQSAAARSLLHSQRVRLLPFAPRPWGKQDLFYLGSHSCALVNVGLETQMSSGAWHLAEGTM